MFFHSIESVQTDIEQSTIREKSKSKSRLLEDCSVNNKEQNVVPLFMTEHTEKITYNINNIQNEWFLMDLK